MKLLLSAILLLVVTSRASSAAPSQNGGASGVPVCLSDLMPCVSFLHSSEQPTVVCCVPLKFALADDVDCLCDIFYSRDLLQTFNVTQQAVRDLPPRCGLRPVDLGKCDNSSGEHCHSLLYLQSLDTFYFSIRGTKFIDSYFDFDFIFFLTQ
ncbi:hypothetical protein MUK42_06764 [Musa troglodytarum]|uniref:Bifunctional inhibitor/plant lipid transfer protein/seed storage helical domain-containing protein n=1 Tax=Musa troglodytarum TaxID=320322 RepID=A0A9E7L4P9_9LILI|nr:hypothetical protein MUK42_06764 [Musa troglodytarum]